MSIWSHGWIDYSIQSKARFKYYTDEPSEKKYYPVMEHPVGKSITDAGIESQYPPLDSRPEIER